MSAVSFLTAVSPSGGESSRETSTKEEKQRDDIRLKKGIFVFVRMMGLGGCVACWQKDRILEKSD